MRSQSLPAVSALETAVATEKIQDQFNKPLDSSAAGIYPPPTPVVQVSATPDNLSPAHNLWNFADISRFPIQHGQEAELVKTLVCFYANTLFDCSPAILI